MHISFRFYPALEKACEIGKVSYDGFLIFIFKIPLTNSIKLDIILWQTTEKVRFATQFYTIGVE